MLLKQWGDIQEDLEDTSYDDFEEGKYGTFIVKNVASGALDGIFISGVIVTAFGLLRTIGDAVKKFRK